MHGKQRLAILDSLLSSFSQIGFQDFGVILDFNRCTFGNRRAKIQNFDALANPHHQAHLVLDQQNGQFEFLANPLDEFHQLVDFIGINPGRRFIEQQQFGFGGHGAGDLQAPLQAVWQVFSQFSGIASPA